MTPKHTNHIKVPVTLPSSFLHTPTLRLEIIKLSQTVGVISCYLVYKLGIIKETCCQQNRTADVFIWSKYDRTTTLRLDSPSQIKQEMHSCVRQQIVMPVCFSVALCLSGLKEADQSCISREEARGVDGGSLFFFKGLMLIPCLYLQPPTDMHKH